MDYSRYKSLNVEVKDWIATVTFNHPETLNVFGKELHEDTEDVFVDLAKDDSIRVVILTGAGRVFSAGGDIKFIKAAAEKLPGEPFPISIFAGFRIINNLINIPKPVIAAINGHAIGLGASLALCCDITIASESARIGDPHVSVGLAASDGGCVIWPLLIGLNRAKQFLFTGDLIEAKEAERIGLINKAVPPDQVMPTAMSLAQRLAAGAPIAISYTKMAANIPLRQRVNEVLQNALALEMHTMHTKDVIEACDAFIEKRKPTFTGT